MNMALRVQIGVNALMVSNWLQHSHVSIWLYIIYLRDLIYQYESMIIQHNILKGSPKKLKLSVPTYGILGLVRDLN